MYDQATFDLLFLEAIQIPKTSMYTKYVIPSIKIYKALNNNIRMRDLHLCRAEAPHPEGSSTRCMTLLLHVNT